VAEVRGLPVKQVIKLNQIQKAMAKGMKASLTELALSQVSRELDFTAIQLFRANLLRQNHHSISLNTLVMAAVARTLPKHPYLNAQLVENEIIVFETVNLGMAVATDAGLVVTVLRDADRLTLQEISERTADQTNRARSGLIGLEDIEGGTFTVSNLGMLGVDSGIPIPRPPESAIILFGAVRPRPVAVNGEVALRETCWATLSYDHRFIDGAKAAAFLQDLSDLLNAPQEYLTLNSDKV